MRPSNCAHADLAALGHVEVGDAAQAALARLAGHGGHGVVEPGVPGQLVALGDLANLLLAALQQAQALGRELQLGPQAQGFFEGALLQGGCGCGRGRCCFDGRGCGGVALQNSLQIAFFAERGFPGGGVGLAVGEAFGVSPPTAPVLMMEPASVTSVRAPRMA